MAIALVADQTNGLAANGGTTTAINSSGANLLVALVSYFGKTEITTHLTDSKGNTWVGLTEYTQASNYNAKAFYCLSPTVGSGHTLTISLAASYPSVSFSAWSGVDTYQTVSGSGSFSVTSIQPGSITPSADGALLLTSMVNPAVKAYAVNSGFTELTNSPYSAGNSMGGEFAYLIQGTAAAINPTWSWTGNTTVAATMVAFNAAGGGGGFSPAWAARRNSRIIGA